jgi:hypothetical protein
MAGWCGLFASGPRNAAGGDGDGPGDTKASNDRIRPVDERGNNRWKPEWGTAGLHLLRGPSGIHYGDGTSSPGGQSRPSARAVSNAIFAQSASVPSSTGMSDYIWTWGQFLDHDFSLTPGNQESLPVPVPCGDPFFDPQSGGANTIAFSRAIFDPATGTNERNPRQQINLITGFIDGSNVYGSDEGRAAWLRTFNGGRLKTYQSSVGELLPFNDGTQPNAGSPEVPDLSPSLFVAGDIRANEQPTLACIHTLMVREHNRRADAIAAAHRGLSDEEIYQRARRLVIAEIQHVTYEEFIPAILGRNPLPRYAGYKPHVNPGVAAVFSTAAYRLGHTLLSPVIQRLDEDGTPIAAGPLRLRDAFFNVVPTELLAEGIEPLLRGVAAQRAQELDALVIDDVRNFLFGNPGEGGLDLISLNIQRGRDLGLPDFNTVRADYGLTRYSSFGQITTNRSMADTLQTLYGSVDNIDAFAGLFVEDDLAGHIVGETLRAVLVDQFRRSRDGDRFWYERSLSDDELREVQSLRLSDIVKLNTKISHLQSNVFYVRGAAPKNSDKEESWSDRHD